MAINVDFLSHEAHFFANKFVCQVHLWLHMLSQLLTADILVKIRSFSTLDDVLETEMRTSIQIWVESLPEKSEKSCLEEKTDVLGRQICESFSSKSAKLNTLSLWVKYRGRSKEVERPQSVFQCKKLWLVKQLSKLVTRRYWSEKLMKN